MTEPETQTITADDEAAIDAILAAELVDEPAPDNDTDPEPANDLEKDEPKDKPKAVAKKKDEPEAEAEPAKEETAEAKSHRALQLREKKLVERQQRVSQERAAFEQERQQFTREAQAIVEERQLAKRDPLAYLERVHGITLEDLGRRILNDGKPDPNEEQRSKLSTFERKIQELEAKLQAKDEETARSRQEQILAQEKQRFCEMVRESDYPLISARYEDSELAEEALRVVSAARLTYGPHVTYTNEEIAEALEERERRREARARGGRPEESLAKTAKSTRATPSKPAAEKTKPAPTLSGKAASAMLPSVDYDPLLLSEDEIDQMALRSAREAIANGR